MLKSASLIGFLFVALATPCKAQTRQLSAPEKGLIAGTYGARLKDPGSAQYQWAPVPLADNLKGGRVAYCFRVNAKNSFGGYTGFKLILGMLARANGKITSFEYMAGNLDDSPELAQTTAELCRTFGIRF